MRKDFIGYLIVCFLFLISVEVYSSFCLANERRELEEDVGLGIVIGFFEEKNISPEIITGNEDYFINHWPIVVKEVLAGSPAQKVGIRVGDQILAINGIPVEEIGANEIARISQKEMKIAEKLKRLEKEIFGPEGTITVLKIKRQGCIDEKSGDKGGMSIGLLSIDFSIKREKNSVISKGGK